MGRVRTKTIKRSARQIVEKYYAKMTFDFQLNKKICEEVAAIPSKRLRNKIAGFSTHLMKRIQKGPVRGISLKMQEEERERRMDVISSTSKLDVETVPVEDEVIQMMKDLDVEVKGICRALPPKPQTERRPMRFRA